MTNLFLNYSPAFSSFSLLSKAEEQELAVKMLKGDKTAREKLILSNLRFAVNEAGKYKYYNIDYEDLVSIAISGLVNSVDHYKIDKNTRLITCAVWWIRAEFKRFREARERMTKYNFTELNGSKDVDDYILSKADTDSMSPEDSAINASFRESFFKNLEKLSPLERRVFLMHKGLCGYSKHSFDKIGKHFGKTKQWACAKFQTAKNFMADLMVDWAA